MNTTLLRKILNIVCQKNHVSFYVSCPVCRKEHLVPDDGVFTPNFIVRNLLEHGKSLIICKTMSGQLFSRIFLAPFDQDHFSQISKRSR